MHLRSVFILTFAILTVNAAPFLGIGNAITGSSAGGGGLLNKVQEIGEKVYEKKRDFLNGINEKVSSMLWLPPLPTKSSGYEVEHLNQPPVRDDPTSNGGRDPDRLIFSSSEVDDGYTEPNLAIYARSSFLSPEDLENNEQKQPRPNVSVSVRNSFSLFGKA